MTSERTLTELEMLRRLGFELEFYRDEHGTPVLFIDTPNMPDAGTRGPACRIYLNDFSLHQGIRHPRQPRPRKTT